MTAIEEQRIAEHYLIANDFAKGRQIFLRNPDLVCKPTGEIVRVGAVQRNDWPVAAPNHTVRSERSHQHVEVRFVIREVGGREEYDVARGVHVIERRKLHVEVRAGSCEAANLQLPRGIDRRRSFRTAQVIDDDPQVGNRRTKRQYLVFGILIAAADDVERHAAPREILQACELGWAERDPLGRTREVTADTDPAPVRGKPLKILSEGRRSDLQIADVGRIEAVGQPIQDPLVVFDDSARLDDACGEDAVRLRYGKVIARQNVSEDWSFRRRRPGYATWPRDLPKVNVGLDDRVR